MRITAYHSATTSAERSTAAPQEIIDSVALGRNIPQVQRVFRFDQIVDAHRFIGHLGNGKRW